MNVGNVVNTKQTIIWLFTFGPQYVKLADDAYDEDGDDYEIYASGCHARIENDKYHYM